nr:MAG TPA: hypothetical protein [Caudoviricetes sp.]
MRKWKALKYLMLGNLLTVSIVSRLIINVVIVRGKSARRKVCLRMVPICLQ